MAEPTVFTLEQVRRERDGFVTPLGVRTVVRIEARLSADQTWELASPCCGQPVQMPRDASDPARFDCGWPWSTTALVGSGEGCGAMWQVEPVRDDAGTIVAFDLEWVRYGDVPVVPVQDGV